ncbi:chemotaxis protein CheR [Spirosoma radiotolerans]|uniref:histidine kinase n=2 Tax=Spirosoma radiotolerans TaxID=1379870 RepID=A0A0E4A053_9BACT|nr:chemotaxis protein CheR [Spirosoma radiotolerans]
MPQHPSSIDLQPGKIPPVPVVAIGASAGGMEAFSELLANLSPTTGLAYVYIQHLSPTYESQLTAILSRVTQMPVQEAEHLLRVEANKVYIIPPNKNMEIIDGVLTLMPRRRKAEPESDSTLELFQHLPIDQFFVSLAERQKEGAIGVVLSGMAHDGTLGLRAIKVAGGITFAQDSTAKYISMPQSAIAEGVVDLVLPPRLIAAELERLSQQPAIFQQTIQAESLPATDDALEEDLRAIIQFLRKAIDVDFSQYKMTTIHRRIIRRMVLYKQETLKDYLHYLRLHPAEPGLLYNDLLINVTSFFRDEETMTFLKTDILPRLIKRKSERSPLRIWVPGCSTGQEAYSLAMMLVELFADEAHSVPVQIFATDLSEMAIGRARQGTYSLSEVANVSPRRLQRFFTKNHTTYQISKTIRDLCVFAPHNIFKDPPFSRIDLVSCRNLLIYVNTILQRKALITFHYALNPDGYLLLGKSETVGSKVSLFTPVEKNHKLFSRKNERSDSITVSEAIVDRPNGSQASPTLTPRTTGATIGRHPSGKSPQAVNDLDKLVDQVLLNHFKPASVLVDQELDIVQFRGETSLYLEHASGRASLNLMKMARPSLAFEIRSSIHKVRRSGQPVHKSGLPITVNGKSHLVSIDVLPVGDGTEERLFLILFQEASLAIPAGSELRDGNHNPLEEELAIVREEMRAIIEEHEIANEELQSANEEIVSSNEELQSINEELETSKEEIESTNEELQTINQELQLRNDQLTEAYMYAEAIFSTIREATLVLDKDLRVKSANQVFYQLYGMKEETTVGRLIYEIGNRQWDIPRLRELLEEVFRQDKFIQGFEMKNVFPDIGEKVMRVHARRVIQQQRQEAILLAIEDITEQRQVQQMMEERQVWLNDIIDSAPTLIWLAGTDSRYTFFNKAWLNYTGHTVSQDTGQGWVKDIHPEDRAEYVALYKISFIAREPYQAEYRLKRSDGEYRWMMENAQPTFGPDGTFSGFIGTCAEVHVQKSLNQELDSRVQERTHELTVANNKLLQTNSELSRTAENLQAVLDTSPAAIGLLKAVRSEQDEVTDFKLVVWNQKFAQVVHEPMKRLPGKLASELADGLWHEETLDQLRQVHENGKATYREWQELVGGQERWISMAIDRHDDGVILTGLDITLLKQAEQQQDRWLQELERSQQTMQDLEQMRRYVRERGEFLRTTSHDLRGSFGVIQGAASLLNLMDTKEEREQMLSMLNRNLGQVTSLLTQLLDYSRLESGQEKVYNQFFDASTVLHELSQSMEPVAGERKLWIRVEGPDTLPVSGDLVKVQRIAQNLVLNALKYTQKGGVTIVWRASDDGGWQLSVQDTGPGMPQQTIRQLLNKAEPTPRNEQEPAVSPTSGEGIGLSIVQQLSAMLKARIEVESEAGVGTLVHVYFA